MEHIRTIHLKLLQERLGEIAGEFTRVRFHSPGTPPPWQPKINVYRCPGHIIVCAELAGLDQSDIELRVEPFLVCLAGRRRTPVPEETRGQLWQILAMEIDDGRYEREILLPEEIAPEAVHAEQRNGLLWIDLPLRRAG
jgi:HSP20 family protein